MATKKKPVKKAPAKKATPKKAAPKKAAPKKVAPKAEQVEVSVDVEVAAVGATSAPKDNAPGIVVYANDVKNKSLRKRILAWFRN
jgi:hypothetical protein